MIDDKKKFLKRLLCCLAARPGTALASLRDQLADRKSDLQCRFGQEAEVMLSVRRHDDPFMKMGGDRKIETTEAFLQVSWPDTWHLDDVIVTVKALGDEMGDIVDIRRSAIAVGTAIVMVDAPGDIFLGFLGRRRPDLTAAAMSDYWTNVHAPMALKLTGPPHSFNGYDQLHVDQERSRRASSLAGFPYVEYDMGDCINVPDLTRFLTIMGDDRIARQLYEDEQKFLDTRSWRGAFTDKI